MMEPELKPEFFNFAVRPDSMGGVTYTLALTTSNNHYFSISSTPSKRFDPSPRH